MVGFGPLASYPLAALPATATTISMTASAGGFALTGVAAVFAVTMVEAAGSYSFTGNDAILTPSVAAGAGSYAFTGNDALFQTAMIASNDPGIDAQTVLCLHGDGVDGSTTITDSSSFSHAVTVVGNTQVDTAQSVFGGGSILFDGAGDYLQLDGSADFAFGTGDFEIDLRVQFSSIAAQQVIIDFRPLSTNGAYPTLIYRSISGKIEYFTNSAFQITGTTTISAGVWYHLALTRSGTSTRLFIGGVQEGATYSDSNNYLVGASCPVIGIRGFDLSTTPLAAWLDEIRVSKGASRWTANFTPPTVVYAQSTFTYTGNSAILTPALSTAAGAYVLTGQDSLFNVTMVEAVGSFTFTGQDLSFLTSLPISAGSYDMTGIAATFTATMAEGVGAFILTGNAATIRLVTEDTTTVRPPLFRRQTDARRGTHWKGRS